MPKYEHFEDLPVWQEAARLYNCVLDLFHTHGSLLSSGYRNQLDRAALSVSNNIAEGFDGITTAELIIFLGYARGSASKTQSMIAVIQPRPALRPAVPHLGEIYLSASACIRQISGWITSIEQGPVQGKRHLTGPAKRQRESDRKYTEFRDLALRSYPPAIPSTTPRKPEKRVARREWGSRSHRLWPIDNRQ